MKRLLFSLLLGLGLMIGMTYAQPEPNSYTLTLTTGQTSTDSIRIPGGMVPVAVHTLDITNATSFTIKISYDRSPTTWLTILELGEATDYTVSIADSSIAPLNANTIMPILGESGSNNNDYVWLKLGDITAEAADKVFVLECRYI